MTSIRESGKRRSGPAGFLSAFVRNPRAVGAIAPSGKVLAGAMAAGLGPGARVLELGGGTGTLTAGLIAVGVRPEDLTVLEIEPRFAALLKERFPGARILSHSAFDLETLPGGSEVDAAISGLPLVNMTAADHTALLRGVFARLAPAGFLRQFTYRPRCPISRGVLDACGAHARYEAMALRNMPPAFIYRIERG